MAKLTTRTLSTTAVSSDNKPKGSALTHSELDSNFLNLETDKLENTTDDFTGTLSIKGSGGSAVGQIDFYDNDDSHKVTIKPLGTVAADYTLTLPPNDGGSGEVLTTDGNGVLTWTAKDVVTAVDIDSFTDGTSITLAGTDKLLVSDGGTEKRINASQIDTYVSGTTSTLTNKTLTSAKINTSLTTAASNTDMIIKPDATGLTDNQNGITGDWGWGGGVTHFNSPVSIGTSDTPDHAQLYNGGLQITTTHLNWATLVLKQKSDNTSYEQFGNVWFVKSNSDTGDAQVEDSDTMGGFYASGWNGATYNQTSAAVYFKAEGDHTGSNHTTDGYNTAQSGNLGASIQFQATPNGDRTKVTVCNMYGEEVDFNVPIKMGEVSKPTAVTDHGFLYTKNVSGTGRVFALDADDTETQISPHNKNGDWEHYSVNHKTGQVTRINMINLIRDLEILTGRKYIENE